MRINEKKLRTYLDQALPPNECDEVKKQLANSPETRAKMARLSQDRHDVTSLLDALAPPPEHHSAALPAWHRLQTKISGQSPTTNILERTKTMFNSSFFKRYQPAIAIFIVVAIIATSLSFAPVRAIASNLLKVFRVQTVQVVRVDREDMEALQNNPNLEALVKKFEPQLDVITDSEPEKVDSLDEAAERVGYPVAEITALPEGAGSPSIAVYQQKVVQLQLDKDLLEAVFDAAEIEIDLPDSINQEPIIVTQPNTVVQKWHQEGKQTLGFIQMPAPAVEYPDDLDLNALGAAGLQLLGMSKDEAEALSTTIDWANTVILPIPNDAQTTISEVSINGAKGLVFTNPEADENHAAIMWMQNGKNYFIGGDYSAEEVVEMAKSVK